MPVRERLPLLILGGTGEAATLAREAVAALGGRLRVITSLAGRTRNPASVPGEVRVGGFGGADGLADYLAHEGIGLVVDATHPFAASISANAVDACVHVGARRLILARPQWRRLPGDRWIEVDDVAQAAVELADRGGRAFLTVGANALSHFAPLREIFCLVRLLEPPAAPPPLANHVLVTGRGPFTVADERKLLAAHRIEIVVSKASGGELTYAKIAAAREMGLPVILVRRPPLPKGERVANVAAALAWIVDRLDDR